MGLISRDLQALEATAAEAERYGRIAATYAAGVSDDRAIVGFADSLRCEIYHDKSAVRAIVVHVPAMNTRQFT